MSIYQSEWSGKGNFDLYAEFRRFKPMDEIPVIVEGVVSRGLREISALDIGGGSGSSSLPLISLLQNHGIEVLEWHVVDVSQEQISSFQDSVQDIIKPRFCFSLADWVEYPLAEEYNLILSLHSWYGVTQWKEEPWTTNSLAKVYQALKSGGIAVIVVSTCDNVLSWISNLIRDQHYRMSGNELCLALDRLGIGYEREKIDLPLPALLEEGELTTATYGIYRYILKMQDLSPIQNVLKERLTEWIEEHESWFSANDFIWLTKP